ncbi:hypothetical protein ACIGCK_03005 [Microbacterium sp. NPDC078428]|uniref:hypothetical protein n=1 Tax=Microbacterium sp. NPDC078428 TaxID=3364190 RepID=UPI0037C8D9BB
MMVGDLGWNEFNLGILGATAALAGLVIVAASVNIAEIVKSRSLTARLGAGIATLVLAITASALAMFPEITLVAYGVAVLASALIAMMFNAHAARAILQNTDPQNGYKGPRAAINFLPAAIYAVGSAMLIAGEPAGLVVVAVGAIVAIPVALMISWIVLVEVLR